MSLSNSSAERKAASYYKACMDVNKTMDQIGSRPLIDVLSDVFASSWMHSAFRGAAADFNESTWNFQRSLERTHILGLDTFFNVWVSQDDKQPTQNILQVVTAVQYCLSKHISHNFFYRRLPTTLWIAFSTLSDHL